jgi:gliding motility-associated-like protein
LRILLNIMKKFLLALILLTSLKSFSQAITVNTSQTPAQLVNTLVNNSCLVQISNVSASTGSNFGSSNGIGTYQNTNSRFNVTSAGVVLTTGRAAGAAGPNTTTLNDGADVPAWEGDAALEAALASAGITVNSQNASVLQFNFIPNTSNFGFDFLFASEEYGRSDQCTSKDSFVVLLTNLSTGVTTNVAVIPSTTTPITVKNIRNSLYSSACSSLNEAFFDTFNGGSNAASSATNYNGQTVLMHASSTLVPNQQYSIRIVIADDGGTTGLDGNLDSAVFLPAGSLNLGQQLFAGDLTIANGNPLCFGQSYVLNTNLDPAIYSFSWTRNGDTIPGASGPSLLVTEAGEYSVTLTRNDIGCVTTQSITIEYAPQINANDPINIVKCDTGNATYTYDLGSNTPIIKQGLDPAIVVTYHISQTNAENDSSPLPLAYTTAPGATIWARVENPATNCFEIKSFQLLAAPGTIASRAPDLILCESTQGSNNAIVNLLQQNDAILNGQPADENSIFYFTSQAAANTNTGAIQNPASFIGTSQTIYARVQKNFDGACFSTTSFNIVVNRLPVLPASSTVNPCNEYTLPALTTGNYYTGSGGTGTMLTAGTVLTTPQIVYIYAINPATQCSNQSTLNVNVISAGTAPANVIACQSYTLPALELGEYHTAPAGGGTTLPAGTEIFTTSTIYYFIPSAASCTQNNSFTVTITTTPVVTELDDVNQCSPYVLPALPNGQRYYTAQNGGGAQIPAGTSISTSQTIYIYTTNPNNAACTAESSFVVTVNIVSVVDRADLSRCAQYDLPPLTAGNYYTAPNGGGNRLNAGDPILTSQRIYIYVQSTVNPACFDEDSFFVTIHPRPALGAIAPVAACNSYTLPNTLPANANYYTQPEGNGTLLPAGTVLTTSQTVYAYAVNAEGCSRQRSFTVTIIDVAASNPGNRTVCGSYILPNLPAGNYYTQANGNGTIIPQGTEITTSRTIYIHIVSNTTPACTADSSFTITIKPLPVLPAIANVVTCGSYTLPALSTGNYYTQPGGTGTMIPAGTTISSTQPLYAYATTGGNPNCSIERPFTVTIVDDSIVPQDVTACQSYTLSPLPVGNYRTAPNGGGSQLNPGTVLTANTTVYVYVPVTIGANCSNNYNFDVSIVPSITADDPADVVACTSYTLPALNNGNYYTLPDGNGDMLPAGTVITETKQLYVYNFVPGLSNCTAQNDFMVTIPVIDVQDMPDVLVCDGYILPQLQLGNYYTGPGGTGVLLSAGNFIDTDETIYIYARTNTTPSCSDEESFTITIKPAPPIDNVDNIGSCGPYILPALTNGSYYTLPGGTGTNLLPGQEISQTTTLYVFAQTGGTPSCTAEDEFTVVINPAAPEDVAACGEYILPVLEVGNYFTGPAGTGTPLFAGQSITTTQDIYVYVDLNTTPNCTDNNKFTVTITPIPILDPVQDVTLCDSYQLPSLSVGNYFTEPLGSGRVIPAGTLLTSTQTVYVYAQTGTVPNCTAQSSFLVTIYHTPAIDARADVVACNSYTLEVLTTGNYYDAPGGPAGGGSQLSAGQVITDTQTIYIYGESATNPNCFAENSFEVEIISITADDPADVTQCDSYTLPALTIGNYYALPGGPGITGQTAFTAGDAITTSRTLYVYAETGGRVNCTSENSMRVTIYQTPVVDDTQTDVAQCTPYILPPLTVGTYYTQPGGTGTRLSPGAAITTPLTPVYIYAASDPARLCFDEHSFIVDVNIVDVTAPADVIACGEYILPALTSGDYYTAPNGGGTMLTAGTQLTASQHLYVYDEAGTTVVCTDQDEFDVTIIQAPLPNQPAPLEECGVDDLGHGIFNLVPAMDFALGGQPNAAASIHETLLDAQFNRNAISGDVSAPQNTSAYRNIRANTQMLYIRLGSTVSDCYTIVELQLIVNPRPAATEPSPFEMCDDTTDGQATFNLTTKNAEILGTLSPAQYSVSYYRLQGDAETATSPIPNPLSFISGTSTIYVRVENNATGCFDVVPMQLIVNPLPQATQPTPYTLCDINNPGDEREVFDLGIKTQEIIGTQEGLILTYFHSYADALAGTGAITNPSAYTNLQTVETVFVVVTVEATGCKRIVLLDVRVEPLPILTAPAAEDRTVCDPDGNGFAEFNLLDLVPDMINNGRDITVTFYGTFQDAQSGVNPIVNPQNYVNEDPFFQTIWIVAENTVTGCQNTEAFSIDLIIVPSPQLPDLGPLSQCDEDANNQDGRTRFDLTQQNAVIYAAPGIGANYVIHYFTSEPSAINDAPRITNDTSYAGRDGEIIWVRVEDPATECYGVTKFELNLGTPLLLSTPSPYTVCNAALPNDTVETFDLTTKDNEILGVNGVGQGFTVQYYVTQADALANTGAIANPESYQNVRNAQTLFVAVTTTDGCRSYTTLTLRVLPLPTPDTTPDALVICDVEGTTGTESFDLTAAEADIRNNDNTTTVTYHLTAEDADQDINAIADPANFESGNATVYVRIEANTNNPADPKCYQVVELQLIVNPLPVLGNAGVIPPFAHCEQNTDGFDTFILTEHNDEVLGTQDPAGYRIRYYRTHPDAVDGTRALPTEYTNTVQGEQPIWVRVDDNTTGCIAIGTFSLFVEEAAIANAPADPNFFTCDIDGTNDGVATFDLTTVEAEVLGTQDPASYSVAYYESEADAEAGQNAIATPEAYNNTFSPDMATIWIRVTNTSTISLCHDVTSIELVVERLAEPVINTNDLGNTVCFEFGTDELLRDLTLYSGVTEPGYTFQWFKDGVEIAGETAESYTAVAPGAYTVIATSPLGCVSGSSPAFTVVKSGPAVAIGNGFTVTNYFSDNQVITVNVQGYGIYEYRLDDGGFQESNVFTNVLPGSHTITVRDTRSEVRCDDILIESVSIVDYPKYFTPNGDGYHETWNIQGFGDDNTDAKIYIFDRYGKLVKQISSQGEGWDGTMNGTRLPGDDYWFTVIYKETVNGVQVTKEYKSHFSLKR